MKSHSDYEINDPPQLKKMPKYQLTLKKNLYDNNIMLDHEGNILCRCSKKKINWYVSRGLATIVNEEPLTIKLNFKPKGEGERNCKFQLEDKENICVVCGESEGLTRHHVVEYEYRKHFPLSYKSHNSYDVLLLCTICHARYEIEAMKLKKQISMKYKIPLSGLGWKNCPKLTSVKKAGAALLKHMDKIPSERREELELILKKHFKVDELNEEIYKKAVEIQTIIKFEDYISHGEGVVKKLDNLVEFIEMWRLHFLKTMKPKFLSHHWSVKCNKDDKLIL